MNRAVLRIGLTRIAAAFCLTLAGIALPSPVDNAYLEGYAAGLLSKDFAFDFTGIKVRRGVMKVPVGGLAANDRTRVLQLLATIPGVFEVRPIERIADRIIEGSAEQDGLRMTGLASTAISKRVRFRADSCSNPCWRILGGLTFRQRSAITSMMNWTATTTHR